MKGEVPTLSPSFLGTSYHNIGTMEIEYVKGQKLGNYQIIFVNRTNNYKGLFKCVCGNKFETRISSIKNNHTKSCGCHKINTVRELKRKHNLSRSKIYKVWAAIKDRCYNSNNLSFHNYGGRGIDIYYIWISDFQAFHDYIKQLDNYGKEKYTIDRINNERGYYPGNIRFTTRTNQIHNRRKNKSLTGFTGITKLKNKYKAALTNDYKSIHIGHYDSIISALEARNDFITINKLPHKLQKYG